MRLILLTLRDGLKKIFHMQKFQAVYLMSVLALEVMMQLVRRFTQSSYIMQSKLDYPWGLSMQA